MSDWQVGDLALCVAIKHPMFRSPSTRLRLMAVYTVTAVGRPVEEMYGERALRLAEVQTWIDGNGFPESLFRKVTPPPADEFDREVIEQMNGAPVEVG